MPLRLWLLFVALPFLAPAQAAVTFSQPVQVVLSIGPDGFVYFLDAEVGLPHATVESVMSKKYDVRTGPYAIGLTMDIQRVPGAFLNPETSGIEMQADAKAVEKWDERKATKLDQQLKERDEALEDRARLLSYAARHDLEPTARAIRVRQLSWLIQNRPEERVLRTPAALVNRTAEPEAYQQLKTLWLAANQRDPGNPRLLVNLCYFIRLAEPEEVRRLLAAHRWALNAPELGETLALSALGVRRLNAVTGELAEFDASTPAASAARAELAATRDFILLSAGFDQLKKAARGLQKQQRLPSEFASWCEPIQKQIRSLDPASKDDCELGPQEVSKGELKQIVRPSYPADAKAEGISGAVELDAVIAETGRVRQLEMRKGPLALYHASRDAVSKWIYKPYLLNGNPTEVLTTIEVNYQLR